MQNKKNSGTQEGINPRQYGVQYGMDANTENMQKDSRAKTNKGGSFVGDPSEMRKAPGYTESVPGVNTPNIELPGAEGKRDSGAASSVFDSAVCDTADALRLENKQDVSIPAFNPPVPNRAWTEMRKGLDIEELSEEERRDLYIGRDRIF